MFSYFKYLCHKCLVICVTTMSKITKPTLKWVGGKSKLKNLISDAAFLLKSKKNKSFDYYEPFFGGGALYFHLKDLGFISSAYLNDTIPQLISYYETISDNENLEDFIRDCGKIETKFNNLLAEEERPINEYKELVTEFNSLWVKEVDTIESDGEINTRRSHIQITPEAVDIKIRSAVLMQCINKLCFNGMFRVNNKNLFNVPIGSYKKIKVIDKENLMNVSKYLSEASLTCNTYKESLKNIKDKDSFIYLDPPYIPNSNTSNFTDYSSQGFKQRDHIELGEIFLKLVNSGNNIILSNNNNQLSRDIFLQSSEVYGYEVLVSKSINSKKTGRGKTSELLVSSFNLDELGLSRV